MVVLDTDTFSHLMRGTPQVVARLLASSRSDVHVPRPVLAEIEYGIRRLGNTKKARALRARFERLQVEIARIDWTDAVSRSFGTTKAQLERAGRLIEDFDVAIAAHALAARATLVSGNAAHMKRVRGLKVESWLD